MDFRILHEYSTLKKIRYTRQSTCDDNIEVPVATLNQLAVHALAAIHAACTHPDIRGKRGALVWASTGSGKTACCTCIIDAFWSYTKFDKLVIVSSPSAMRSNPPENYYRFARMFPRFSSASSMEELKDAFDKRGVFFTTFAKLAHYSGVYRPSVSGEKFRKKTGSTVFIVDEAHTMFKPLPTQRQEMKAVLETLFGEHGTGDIFFLMTATPGESRSEVLKLLNMLRNTAEIGKLQAPQNTEQCIEFVKQCSLMISRYDAFDDTGIYPSVRVVDIMLPMSYEQYVRYREAVIKTSREDTDFDELKRRQRLDKLYASARRFANSLYQVDVKRPLKMSSAKLPELLSRIMSHPEGNALRLLRIRRHARPRWTGSTCYRVCAGAIWGVRPRG
jgi:hypothetical protein